MRHDGTPGAWTAIDVSEGGMFLAGSALDPGTDLKLGIVLPNQEIIAHARVVWTNDPSDPGSNPRLPAGMGVQFQDLDDESRHILQAYTGGSDSSHPSQIGLGEDIQPGVNIGSYTIEDKLGAGGMSSVYLAEHVQLGRRVALKRLHPRWADDADAVRRFFDEGRLVNRVRHEHIVEITDFISEGTDKYYVMELLEGTPLDRVIARGPLSIPRTIDIAAQLCDGVAAVHDAGIVHRDLKPGNIMLVTTGGREDFVKLLDFGIAKQRMPSGGVSHTIPGVVVGTPTYIAPEYSLGQEPDHRADLYSLGIVLFQLLTGRTAFEAPSWPEMLLMHVNDAPPSPSELRRGGLPEALDALVLELLEKQPEARPANAREVAERLRAIDLDDDLPWLDAREVASPPPRRRGALVLGAAAAAVLAATAVVIALSTPQEQPAVTPAPIPLVTPAASPEAASPSVASELPIASPSKAPAHKRRPKKVHRRGTIDPFE